MYVLETIAMELQGVFLFDLYLILFLCQKSITII